MAQRRAYLQTEKDPSFDFESALPDNAELSEIFFELTRRLEAQYSINKGVLMLKNTAENGFSAVSTWHNGELRDGLAINLPTDPSLFNDVASDGIVYTEQYSGIFNGNFFERKLLLDENSQSFMLHPLKHEGKVIGMLGYSSEEPTAFTMFEQGALASVASEFASIIYNRLMND